MERNRVDFVACVENAPPAPLSMSATGDELSVAEDDDEVPSEATMGGGCTSLWGETDGQSAIGLDA